MTPPASVAQGGVTTSPDPWSGWPKISSIRPPCIELVWEVGPSQDDPNPKEVLRQLCLHFKEAVATTYPKISFEEWLDSGEYGDNLARLQQWNRRTGGRLTDADVEEVAVKVGDSDRTRFTCTGAKRCLSLKQGCDPDDCKLCKAKAATEGEGEEVPEELKDLASLILREGKPLDLIVDSCERFVLGARDATRKLVCCEMVQLIPSSRGLHPKLNGESGSGKTWCLKVFLHHLPSDAYVAGGLTPKALAYHMLGDKLFIVLDDYVPNEDLDTIMKVTSSSFHKPYLHRTVKRQEGITLTIGKEMTWCVTSVDASQDIQVLNRQIPLNTDDSEDLTAMVNAHTISSYGEGLPELYEDETVLICREMFRQLRALDEIKIRVPFTDRVEWLDTSNRRNPSIFMDILIGITALHCFQREVDEDGYYLATEEDFECAKSLFTDNVDVQELINRLTTKERQFAELLVTHPEGLTRQEVSEMLKVSPARVSQIARGEKKGDDGGLMQKLPGFDMVPVTRRLSDYESRTYQVYQLNTYDRLAGFDAVVRLNPNCKGGVSQEANSKNDSKGVTTYSSKYSKYIIRKNLTGPLTGEVSLSLSNSQNKPYSPYSDSRRGLTGDLSPKNQPYNLTLDSSQKAYLVLKDIPTFTDGAKSWTLKRGDLFSGLSDVLAKLLIENESVQEVKE